MSVALPSTSLAAYSNHSLPLSVPSTPAIDHGVHSNELTDHQVFVKRTEFIRAMKHKFHDNSKSVRALKKVIHFVSDNGCSSVHNFLFKESGYLSRLFYSEESWGEWTENRTPLGQVVSAYCDYVQSSTAVGKFFKHFDEEFLQKANQEAVAIQKSLISKKTPPRQKALPSWSSYFSFPMAEAAPVKRGFPAGIELSSLNGKNGFKLDGGGGDIQTGYSVSKGGDINGDGFEDFLIGDPQAYNQQSWSGRVYVVFGTNSTFFTPFDLTKLNSTNGFIINGVGHRNWLGNSASGIGDFNKDGFDDFLVCAPNVSKCYVIFGGKRKWPSPFDLNSLNGKNGFCLFGERKEWSGSSASGVGDVNGDRTPDIAIGAPSINYPQGPGRVYVVFGHAGPWPASFNLSSLNGTSGAILTGETNGDFCGFSVSGTGDFNGDHVGDLVVGAPTSYSTNIGRIHVVYGLKGFWPSPFYMSKLNGTNGFTMVGDYLVNLGRSVSGVDDFNGDGFPDIVGGAIGGQAFVLYGSNVTRSSALSIDDINGINGFRIYSNDSSDFCGFSVGNAGDINGDGNPDLSIGAINASPNGQGSGKSYVVFGGKRNESSFFELSRLNGQNGFVLYGEDANDMSGYSVTGIGDFNKDGVDDLGIGAPGWGSTGRGYVLYGQKV